MELRLPHMLHLFNVFRENDGKENCAQVLEEELHRMLGIKYVNDEQDCKVVSMNSLNIQNANECCTSHEKNVSYKNVNFCGVNWECKCTQKREDRFCKKHKYLEMKKFALEIEMANLIAKFTSNRTKRT